MQIFIDESGDAGFKTDKGSSKCLVVCLVCFKDEELATKTIQAINQLRSDLGWPSKVEFKFSKTKHDIRERFFKAVAHIPFEICAIVMQKDLIRSDHLRSNKDDFYKYTVKHGLGSAASLIENADIFIDGSGDRLFKQEFSSYLRREFSPAYGIHFKSFRFVKESENNQLIQLADMCAGAIGRSYSPEKKNYELYKQLINRRIRNEWAFK
jgi:hypothetical protein